MKKLTSAGKQYDKSVVDFPDNVAVGLLPEMLTFAQLYAQYRRMTTTESVNVILRMLFYKVSKDLIHGRNAREAMNKIAPGVADRILDLWWLDQIQRPCSGYAKIGSEVADTGTVEVAPILAEFAQLYTEYACKRAGCELPGRNNPVNFIVASFLSDQAAALLRDSGYRAELDEEVPGIAGLILQLADRCF